MKEIREKCCEIAELKREICSLQLKALKNRRETREQHVMENGRCKVHALWASLVTAQRKATNVRAIKKAFYPMAHNDTPQSLALPDIPSTPDAWLIPMAHQNEAVPSDSVVTDDSKTGKNGC